MIFQFQLSWLSLLYAILHFALSITTAPPLPLAPLARRQDSPACRSWFAIEESCINATPSFSQLPLRRQAACLCYSSGTFQATVFDNAFAGCISTLRTADPADFYAYGGANLPSTPCAQIGDVLASTAAPLPPSTALASITAPPQTGVPNTARPCQAWNALQTACAGSTSDFSSLPFASQASCLCYTGATYAPAAYDDVFASCVDVFKKADPGDYATLGPSGGDKVVRTPCASAGNVRSVAATATAAPSTSEGSTTVPPSSTSAVPTTKALTTSISKASQPRARMDAVLLLLWAFTLL